MKKIVLTLAAMAIAMIAGAQITADGLLGMCPTLPGESDMINKSDLFLEFETKCKEASERANELVEKTYRNTYHMTDAQKAQMANAKNLADKMKGMTPEQQKAFAMQLAKQRTGGIDVSALSKMTPAQREAAAKKMAEQMKANASINGMSLDDIEALLSVKDDYQRANIAEQMGLTVTPEQAAKIQQQVRRSDAKLKKVEGLVNKSQELTKDLQRINELELAREDVIAEGVQLWKTKFEKRYDELTKELEKNGWDDTGNDQACNNRHKAISAQIANLIKDFYTQYVPLYRANVMEQLDYIRTDAIPHAVSYTNNLKKMGQGTTNVPAELELGLLYLDCARQLAYYEDVMEKIGD